MTGLNSTVNTEYHPLQRFCYVNLKLLRIRGYVTAFAFCFRKSYTFDMTDESLRINAVLKNKCISNTWAVRFDYLCFIVDHLWVIGFYNKYVRKHSTYMYRHVLSLNIFQCIVTTEDMYNNRRRHVLIMVTKRQTSVIGIHVYMLLDPVTSLDLIHRIRKLMCF